MKLTPIRSAPKVSETGVLGRRDVLGGLGATAGVLALPAPAFAITEARAGALIQQVVGEIQGVISSGKSESAMIRDFEKIFARHGDNSYIAAFTLGRAAASKASNGQKKEYSAAFAKYMASKYGKRFREFIGGQIAVSKVRKVKSWYEVDTIVTLRGQPPFDVTFRVWDRSGKDLFFNMIIAGVNLLIVEKQEIASMLERRRGDLNTLIKDLSALG